MHKKLLLLAVLTVATLLVSGKAHAAENPNTTTPKPDQKYTVASGDNLSTIATNFQLDSWVPIWNSNTQISNPDLIYVGQEITIPGGDTTPRPLPEATSLPKPKVQTNGSVQHKAVYTAPSGDIFGRIRQRESGGNYATNTGNGYYGAYQFSLGTWRSVGGSGLPSDASPAEQDARAAMLYSSRGCNPWPNTCY